MQQPSGEMSALQLIKVDKLNNNNKYLNKII